MDELSRIQLNNVSSLSQFQNDWGRYQGNKSAEPLLPLQREQQRAKFQRRVGPPLDLGIMWSKVHDVAGAPQ